ncbi:MAG: response regulator [Ktedonobacterales bacterium]
MGRQIVIVDDEADIISILSEVLRGEGYDPIPFVNPGRALEHCIATPPALVMTDLLMPLMSGQELVMRLRERYGTALPIIVMSASVNIAAVAPLPIQAFLSKPFDLDDLSELLRRVLAAAPAAIPATVRPPVW